MRATTHGSAIPANLGRSLPAFLLILACIPSPAGSEELGRLFFSPERRQMLDRQRQFNIQERKEIPEDPTLTINGVVTRSSGKRTVWINGAAQDDRDVSSGVIASPRAKNPARVVVQGSEAPAAEIGVGGTVNRNTGETADLLGGGRVIIKSRP